MSYSTNDGVKIYYEVSGEGFPLVLIHANPFDHELWMFQTSHFSSHYKVIALDLRGYGKSDKPTNNFTLEDMAQDVLAVCRDEDVEEAVVMGASVGSAIALLLAIHHSEMVKALILNGGSSKGGRRVQERIRGYTEIGVAKYMPQHLGAMVGPEFKNSRVGRYLLHRFESKSLHLSGETIAQIFRARANMDLSPHLPNLKVPTLVINGQLDHSLPSGLQTAFMIPGAAHKVIPGTGHCCCIEDPGEFNLLVEEFLADRGLSAGVD